MLVGARWGPADPHPSRPCGSLMDASANQGWCIRAADKIVDAVCFGDLRLRVHLRTIRESPSYVAAQRFSEISDPAIHRARPRTGADGHRNGTAR